MRIPSGPVTNALVAISVLVWIIVWTGILFFGLSEEIVLEAGFIPARAMAGGAEIPAYDFPARAYYVPFALTPLTAAFLHLDFLHLLFNMLMLLFTGRFVEMALGKGPVLLLYVAGAYCAALGEYWAGPQSASPMIGASGAASAIIAVYMMLYSRTRARPWGPVPAYVTRMASLLFLWVVLNLGMGLAMSGGGIRIAIWAHIGGFVAGLILFRPLLAWRYRHA